MKKYIKTKDGRIFQVTATPENNSLYRGSNMCQIYDHVKMTRRDIRTADIIAQADTIEELVNEFKVKNPKKKRYVADDVDKFIREKEAALDACGDFGENGL